MTFARIDARSVRPGVVAPPPSKSDAQRALVLAHALGRPELVRFDEPSALPADVQRLARGLEQLREAAPGEDEVTIDCGDGGAPFRFLLTQCAVHPVRAALIGSERLGERPHRALIDALLRTLEPAGARIELGAPWPVRIRGLAEAVMETPRFVIDAGESSQFASSLLLGCATLAQREQRGWTVELEGDAASPGYLELTLEWLRRAGFGVRRRERFFEVTPSRGPVSFEVPGDWSSLGYLLVLAWATGGSVLGVDVSAAHPDREILRVFDDLGLKLEGGGATPVRVTGAPTQGLVASGTQCPDLLPTLAALACALRTESRLTDVDILRNKESDRLEGILRLVEAAGGSVVHLGSELVIRPPARPATRFHFNPHDDHRMAMSAATLAVLLRAELDLEDPGCVRKSFPAFWSELGKLGVVVTEQ